MNKAVYYFGIFFIGFSTLCNFSQSLMQLKLGPQFYSVPSFPSWFILTTLIDLTGSIVMLKYCYYKKYWAMFSIGIIMQVALLFLYFVTYQILVLRSSQDIYLPAIFTVLSISILYGMSIVFSRAGNRFWLKAAGIIQLIFGLILISSYIWSTHSLDSELQMMLEKVNLWTTRAVIIIPGLFILNFLSELQDEKTISSVKIPLNFIMALSVIAALISAFIIGKELLNESISVVRSQSIISGSATGMAKPFEARIYKDNQGNKMGYRLLKPRDYNPQKKYPIVVLLHHGGAHGTDNIKQVEGSEAPFLSNYENIRKYPAFLFIPQCPQGLSWMSPVTDLLAFKIIQNLEKEFSIDVKRRYVMGVSGGGYGSWHFIGAHPGMFAAAIPICGGGDPDQAKNMVDVAIWAFHGKNDGLAPVSGSRDMITAIKRAGGNPRYTEYPGEGHNIAGKVKLTPGLMDWLFSQKRKEEDKK